MENSTRKYYRSIDFMKALLIICLIFSACGLPTSYSQYIQVFLNFASCTLLTIYGYFVLRDGADLKKNIINTFKLFLILFLSYSVFTFILKWIISGTPYVTVELFNLLIFNNNTFGPPYSFLWLIISPTYALVFFYLLRKFKKYDWIACIVFFAISFVVSDFPYLIGISNFLKSFTGYYYIPQSFITKAIPYMLLGRIIHNYMPTLYKLKDLPLIGIALAGALLSAGEFYLLFHFEYLVCGTSLVGFIPVSFALTIWCIKHSFKNEQYDFLNFAPKFNNWMFYTFMPIYTLIIQISNALDFYNSIASYIGIIVFVLSAGAGALASFLQYKKDKKLGKVKKEEIDENILQEIEK